MGEKLNLTGWWGFWLVLLVLTIVVLSVLGYLGKFTSTAVERVVFEQSYQKQAGDSARLNAYRAQLSAINARLVGNVSDDIRADLEAQKAMLQIQIQGATK